MKKIFGLIILLLMLPCTVNAGVIDKTTQYANDAMFWKGEHLESIDFKHIYPKSFYEKSSFGFVITGAAIVGAGAFSYFTAGAGAPAAATGVSTVASWVAGGGAGSYMAGLSTIGGWFGGNAILGASVLNGISIGTIGGASSFAALPVLGKAGVMASVTAMGLDGVVYYSNPTTKNLEYKVKVAIPKNLGSKNTRKLIDNIYETKDAINAAFEDADQAKQEAFFLLNQRYNENAIKMLRANLLKDNNQEDLIVLGIIAWNNSEYELFDKAVSQINVSKLDNTGFLYYLYALQSLHSGNIEKSLLHLDNSIAENPYSLEPVILYINVLGNQDFMKDHLKIESLVEKAKEGFDSDEYASEYALTAVYYRVATFYFANQRYVKAKQYFEKAYDELGMIQKYLFGTQLKHSIQLGIANSLYAQNKKTSADSVYNEIINDIDEENIDEINYVTKQYLGKGS